MKPRSVPIALLAERAERNSLLTSAVIIQTLCDTVYKMLKHEEQRKQQNWALSPKPSRRCTYPDPMSKECEVGVWRVSWRVENVPRKSKGKKWRGSFSKDKYDFVIGRKTEQNVKEMIECLLAITFDLGLVA